MLAGGAGAGLDRLPAARARGRAPASSTRRRATTFWGAMQTIVIADAVMGLDNVLAVAGAAHGSYLLVVIGLVISVPIVVWGSTLMLQVGRALPGDRLHRRRRAGLDRGEDDQRRAAAQGRNRGDAAARSAALSGDSARPRRRLLQKPSSPRVAHPRPAGVADARAAGACQRGDAGGAGRVGAGLGLGVGVGVGAADSKRRRAPRAERSRPSRRRSNSLRAVRHAIAEYRRHHELRVHLLNVQPRLSRHAARFVSRADRDGWLHRPGRGGDGSGGRAPH